MAAEAWIDSEMSLLYLRFVAIADFQKVLVWYEFVDLLPDMIEPAQIKRLREANNVSQPVFARYLNTSESTIEKSSAPTLCNMAAEAWIDSEMSLLYLRFVAIADFQKGMILAKGGRYWIYEYLFAKKDRDNIDDDELRDFKLLAKSSAFR
jgi:transcriptional regulator with XRE-family HTH domain